MLIDLNELDLIKATPWREELHPRGKDGKFSSIRSGSKVVAKNGTKGKVTQVTDTHYHIEKEDGKVSKIVKDNVIHEKDHKELTAKKKAPKKKAPKKKAPAKKTPAKKASESKKSKEPKELTIFHGTSLVKAKTIQQEGFKAQRSSQQDMGKCAYFKSPEFDTMDKRSQKTKDIVNEFAKTYIDGQTYRNLSSNEEKTYSSGIVQATVSREHVADFTKGRPKELQDMIDSAPKYKDGTPKWNKNKSPYEIYAKKHGIKVIIDRLPTKFDTEGVQIGVYDPSVIKVKSVGKKLKGSGEKLELLKSLESLESNELPYCLIHHAMDEEGNLILYVGAIDNDMEKGMFIDLSKAIPWREELHPRGKDGKFSSIRSGSKVVAKNGTKGKVTQVTDTHYHIEKEDGKTSKIVKDNVVHEKDHKELTAKKKAPKKKASTKKGAGKSDKKTTSKPKASPTGKKSGASNGRKSSGGTTATKEPKPKKTGTKKPSEAKKTAPKKPKSDIRSDVQKNRSLAYDAGEKVGGSRKDTWEQSFKATPNLKTLADLEKDNPAVAQKLAVKKHVLPPFDFEAEHKKGTELPVAIMKKLIFDRIAPKPEGDTPEARQKYVQGVNKAYRHFAGIKTLDNMKNAVREFSDLAGRGKSGREAMDSLKKYAENPNRWSYFNHEHHMERAERGAEALAQMDFSALGDKFEGFFTSYKSRESTMKTVIKNTKEGWDKYLNPETKPKSGGKPKDGNKKWERKAEAEHLRTGGKKVTMNKPEELMKNFGVRGVEFGHWVNDASGKYHLQRSAEAFHDLADVLGIDPKDISLNGRLAIAFGARGSGTALAHYEPDRKVINMTKHGGAGSLAHEWGHAMDNIMYQYSNGGRESMSLASEAPLGDTDPKLKAYYENLMEAITKPAPGDKGGVTKISLDSSEKPPSKYYPEMRRDVNSDMTVEQVYHKWADKLAGKYDQYIANTKANRTGLRSQADIDKTVKKYEGQKKRELNSLRHYLAMELRHKQNGGKYSGDHYKGEIEVSTGKSEYMTRMEEGDGNGKAYLATNAEMFARVFESYVQHKLDKDKRYNNYLVHSTREKDVTAMDAPFPKGKERTHMFKAMENLIKHISKGKALKKALEMELLKSYEGTGTMQKVSLEQLLSSIHSNNLNAQFRRNRSAYNVKDPSEVIYIPINRLTFPYQTERATDFDKVQENLQRMKLGENLEPIVIGFDYDVHDGHHRVDASRIMEFTHMPCVVMKTPNEVERQRAIEAYQEVWKSMGKEAYEEDEAYIYRGMGQKELDFIQRNGYIQSKGKGNDEDKNNSFTCFSTLFSQAVGYARSNYDLYNEKKAYVIALPKPDHLREVDGEIVAKGKTSSEGMLVIPIPQEIR